MDTPHAVLEVSLLLMANHVRVRAQCHGLIDAVDVESTTYDVTPDGGGCISTSGSCTISAESTTLKSCVVITCDELGSIHLGSSQLCAADGVTTAHDATADVGSDKNPNDR